MSHKDAWVLVGVSHKDTQVLVSISHGLAHQWMRILKLWPLKYSVNAVMGHKSSFVLAAILPHYSWYNPVETMHI